MSVLLRRRMSVHLAIASLIVAVVALGIITVAVLRVGRDQFERLMMSHGATHSEATAMFQQTVGEVFVVSLVAAIVVSVGLAVLLSRYLTSPLRAMGQAANRVGRGDYSVRVAAGGPDEVRSVADTFNQMAHSLQQQEQVRREFIEGAAHELLTPLTNLQGYLEALRDGVIAPETATFASLHEEAERLVRLSRSLLTLADVAAESNEKSTDAVDLRRVVAATVDLTQPAFARRNIRVRVDIPTELPVRANSDHATQVLVNLLQNAARYADRGSEVVVTGSIVEDDVRIAVANTGAQIPEGDVERVFERFYRVDRSREQRTGGSGLGLAVVKRLVEVAGGHVGAESRSGQTLFWFTLPAA